MAAWMPKARGPSKAQLLSSTSSFEMDKTSTSVSPAKGILLSDEFEIVVGSSIAAIPIVGGTAA